MVMCHTGSCYKPVQTSSVLLCVFKYLMYASSTCSSYLQWPQGMSGGQQAAPSPHPHRGCTFLEMCRAFSQLSPAISMSSASFTMSTRRYSSPAWRGWGRGGAGPSHTPTAPTSHYLLILSNVGQPVADQRYHIGCTVFNEFARQVHSLRGRGCSLHPSHAHTT